MVLRHLNYFSFMFVYPYFHDQYIIHKSLQK